MDPMTKQYGTISPVPRTDEIVYECFEVLSEDTQKAFVRKFREQIGDVPRVQHTFRELVLGAYVAKQGFHAEYEPPIDPRAPAWLMTQRATGKKLLMELVKFHLPNKLEGERWEAFKNGWMWFNRTGPNSDRANGRLQQQMAGHKTLADKHDFHYVVGIFGLFASKLTLEEVQTCLEGADALFGLYTEVSGVLYFHRLGSEFLFHYLPNPHAKRNEIVLLDGSLPTPP